MSVFKIVGFICKTLADGAIHSTVVKYYVKARDEREAFRKADALNVSCSRVSYFGEHADVITDI